MIFNSVIPAPASATPTAGKRHDDKTAKVAQQFEALFVAQMLKSAHAAALVADPLAGDPTFRDFQDEARAQALAAAAPLGVARLLAKAR